MAKHGLKIYLIAFLFCIAWSSGGVAAKIGIQSSPPLLLLCIRFIIAGSLMCFFVSIKEALPSSRVLAIYLLLGFFNNSLYLGLFFYGVQFTTAGMSAVIASTNSMMTVFIAHFILGERINSRKIIGLLLGALGVILLTYHKIAAQGTGQFIGIICIFIGTFAFSCGTILYRKFSHIGNPLVANGWSTLLGGIILLPFALMVEDVSNIHLTSSFILAMSWMVFILSIGSVFLWLFLIKSTDAASASSVHFLMPFIGIILGNLVLGEAITPSELIGIIPISAGIYLIIKNKKQMVMTS